MIYVGLMGTWGLFARKDTMKIWIEKANKVNTSMQFRCVVKKMKDMIKKEAANLRRKTEKFGRETEEERRRLKREAEIQRELEEQLRNTIVVVAPVFCVDDLSVEYVRVYTSQVADVFSLGGSQPPTTQTQEPSPQHPSPNQPQPSPQQPKPEQRALPQQPQPE